MTEMHDLRISILHVDTSQMCVSHVVCIRPPNHSRKNESKVKLVEAKNVF
jgi:hypothetical protein